MVCMKRRLESHGFGGVLGSLGEAELGVVQAEGSYGLELLNGVELMRFCGVLIERQRDLVLELWVSSFLEVTNDKKRKARIFFFGLEC